MAVSAGKTPLHSYFPGSAMAPEALDFEFIDSADLVVFDSDDATLTEGVDYEITGDSRTASASITALVEVGGSVEWTIYSLTPPENQFEVGTSSFFDREQAEREFDRAAIIQREHTRDIGRALKVPLGVSGYNVNVSGIAVGQVLFLADAETIAGVDNDPASAAASALQAGVYSSDAGIYYQGAFDAATLAGGYRDDVLAQVSVATLAATSASEDADRAEAARDVAATTVGIHADAAAGILATSIGERFHAWGTGQYYVERYLHDVGDVAVFEVGYPTLEALFIANYYEADFEDISFIDHLSTGHMARVDAVEGPYFTLPQVVPPDGTAADWLRHRDETMIRGPRNEVHGVMFNGNVGWLLSSTDDTGGVRVGSGGYCGKTADTLRYKVLFAAKQFETAGNQTDDDPANIAISTAEFDRFGVPSNVTVTTRLLECETGFVGKPVTTISFTDDQRLHLLFAITNPSVPEQKLYEMVTTWPNFGTVWTAGVGGAVVAIGSSTTAARLITESDDDDLIPLGWDTWSMSPHAGIVDGDGNGFGGYWGRETEAVGGTVKRRQGVVRRDAVTGDIADFWHVDRMNGTPSGDPLESRITGEISIEFSNDGQSIIISARPEPGYTSRAFWQINATTGAYEDSWEVEGLPSGPMSGALWRRGNALLLAAPANYAGSSQTDYDMTVSASYDDGRTWTDSPPLEADRDVRYHFSMDGQELDPPVVRPAYSGNPFVVRLPEDAGFDLLGHEFRGPQADGGFQDYCCMVTRPVNAGNAFRRVQNWEAGR